MANSVDPDQTAELASRFFFDALGAGGEEGTRG